PVSDIGNIIRREWLRYYDVAPSADSDTYVTQSWDTAMKGDQIHDFAVCTTWLKSGGNHYLIDLVRQRCEYPSLIQLLLQQYRRFGPDAVLIEDRGTGTTLIQDLLYYHQIHSIAMKPDGDKETRFAAAAVLVEQRK